LLDQLLGGSTIQTANLEKKKKDFALCQQNAWNFDQVWWTLQWTEYMSQKRAALGREKEKESDVGLQNSNLIVQNHYSKSKRIHQASYFYHISSSFFAKRCSKSNLNVWRFLDGCFSLGKICKSEHLIQEEWWKFQWNIKEGLKPPVICGWFLRKYYFKTAPNFIANVAKFGH